GIGWLRRRLILGYSDDKCIPAALRERNTVEHQQKCKHANERSDQDDHRNWQSAQSRWGSWAPQSRLKVTRSSRGAPKCYARAAGDRAKPPFPRRIRRVNRKPRERRIKVRCRPIRPFEAARCCELL